MGRRSGKARTLMLALSKGTGGHQGRGDKEGSDAAPGRGPIQRPSWTWLLERRGRTRMGGYGRGVVGPDAGHRPRTGSRPASAGHYAGTARDGPKPSGL